MLKRVPRAPGMVFDAPTPFLRDGNLHDAIAYDRHQIVLTAMTLANVRSGRSPVGEVWFELQRYWATDADYHPSLVETRTEHLLCAVHGWTLEELHDEYLLSLRAQAS